MNEADLTAMRNELKPSIVVVSPIRGASSVSTFDVEALHLGKRKLQNNREDGIGLQNKVFYLDIGHLNWIFHREPTLS